MERCPRCDSPSPEMHPSVQFEGEVAICTHPFHLTPGGSNRPEYIAMVQTEIARKAAAGVMPEMVAQP